MQQKFEKGTELWQMMADFNRFQSDFWNVEKSDEYWNNFMQKMNELAKKYENFDKIYIQNILLAFMNIQEEKVRLLQGSD